MKNNMADNNFEDRATVRATLKPMHRTVDIEGIIIDCNDKYAYMLGYTKDEVIGASILDHTPVEHRNVVRDISAN